MRSVVLAVAFGSLCATALTGCIERRLSITSNPPGARVWVNDQSVGRTPLETTFVYHGVYDIRLEAEGYEPLVTNAKAVAPWWEYPPIDLIASALPWRVWNTQDWSFQLEPSLESTLGREELEEGLMQRATEMRSDTAGNPE